MSEERRKCWPNWRTANNSQFHYYVDSFMLIWTNLWTWSLFLVIMSEHIEFLVLIFILLFYILTLSFTGHQNPCFSINVHSFLKQNYSLSVHFFIVLDAYFSWQYVLHFVIINLSVYHSRLWAPWGQEPCLTRFFLIPRT